VLSKAREIVAEVQEQRRLQRCAYMSANKALLAVKDAFDQMYDASSSEADRECWRERQALVERELRRIIKGTRP
jgi:molecular chaperone GrpE (heat shock protein)